MPVYLSKAGPANERHAQRFLGCEARQHAPAGYRSSAQAHRVAHLPDAGRDRCHAVYLLGLSNVN